MLLFLIFFPRNPQPSEMDEQDASIPTWKEAVLVLAVSLAFFVVALLGSIIFVYAAPTHVRGWANFLGLLATALAAIQYIPQILMTWKLQETGSLSVPMMCIQTPGSFVFAASLAVRLGPGGWSAWGLFIFTGCLQGVLGSSGRMGKLQSMRMIMSLMEMGTVGVMNRRRCYMTTRKIGSHYA
jgi:hypothetical protein